MSDEHESRSGSASESGQEQGKVSRRRFLATGAAFGGAVVWTPAAFGRLAKPSVAAGNPGDAIRALRAKVENSGVKPTRFRMRLLRILGDAVDFFEDGKINKCCKKLSQFEEVVAGHAGAEIPAGTAASWIEEAEMIKAKLGCAGATGPPV